MKITRHIVRATLVATATVGAGMASAHDFWLEPMTFTVAAKQSIDLSIKVGTGADVESLPWMSVHVERCFATDGTTRLEIESETDCIPAAQFALPSAGIWTIAYNSFDSRVEMEPAKFESYLREEGLEAIIDERTKRGESGKPSRELFSRCAKTLIRVTEVPNTAPSPKIAMAASQAMPVVQLPLELVAETDPYLAKPGEKVAFRLVLRGQFLEGALVQAKRLDHTRKLAARTDKDGRVEFDLDADRAAWMITAVYMERAPKRSNAEWKSLWATLAFEMMERDTVPSVSVSSHEGKS